MSEKFFDSNNLDAWAKAAAKQSPGGDVGNLVWNTPEGLAVKALYSKADVAHLIVASPPATGTTCSEGGAISWAM